MRPRGRHPTHRQPLSPASHQRTRIACNPAEPTRSHRSWPPRHPANNLRYPRTAARPSRQLKAVRIAFASLACFMAFIEEPTGKKRSVSE